MLFGGVERVGLGPVVAERSPLKTGSSVGPRLRGFGGFGSMMVPDYAMIGEIMPYFLFLRSIMDVNFSQVSAMR